MDNKAIAIYQDQRIAEEFCNFRCDYCGGLCPIEYTTRKDENGNLTVPDEWHNMINNMPEKVKKQFDSGITFKNHYDLSVKIMKQTKEIMNSDILKISGGELTLYEGLCEFVNSIHDDYLSIQILSNGFKLTKEDILKYKEMGNVSFQISIDGVTHESNYSKSHSKFITNAVLSNIEYLLQNEIGVEINCVLTKYNTDKFLQILNHFKNAKNFIIVPRPVRGEARKSIDFSQEQVLIFEKCINENYDEFSNILPPKVYFERVIDMMKTQKRNFVCYIPYFVQSIDGYGNYEMCPLGLCYHSRKNIINNEVSKFDVLLNSEYNVIGNYSKCDYCMVQYEMFNLYIDNEITEGDLKRMPSLNNDIIISHITDIKEEIKMKKLEDMLKRDYNLENITIEKSDESTDGNVYIIDSKNLKCVAKVYENIDHVKSMIQIHKDLIKNNMYVPKIITTLNGDDFTDMGNGKYVVIYSFLDGLQIGDKYKNIPSDVVCKIAKELKKFHDITSGNNKYNVKNIPFNVESNINRCSALHFDLTRSNIFCTNDDKCTIGFIDFDDAKYGKSICDVAIAIANMFFSKTRGADIEGLTTFINSYYEDDLDLKEKEMKYIKQYAITWINYVMDGNEFDSSTVESFDIRKELMEKYFTNDDITN